MLKYQKIAYEIKKYIEDNDLQQGHKLPVLEKLMKQFSASKSTLSNALDLLENKGDIYQVRGSGIFVRRHKRKKYINLLSKQGFKKDIEHLKITSKVIEIELRNINIE